MFVTFFSFANRNAIAMHLVEESIEANELIIKEGAEGDELYIVKSVRTT